VLRTIVIPNATRNGHERHASGHASQPRGQRITELALDRPRRHIRVKNDVAHRRDQRGIGTSDPGMISFTLPEIRRLVISLIQACSPDPERVWSWSRWRRRRHYQARLCHCKQRGYALG
jgi:hypothetical protein